MRVEQEARQWRRTRASLVKREKRFWSYARRLAVLEAEVAHLRGTVRILEDWLYIAERRTKPDDLQKKRRRPMAAREVKPWGGGFSLNGDEATAGLGGRDGTW